MNKPNDNSITIVFSALYKKLLMSGADLNVFLNIFNKGGYTGKKLPVLSKVPTFFAYPKTLVNFNTLFFLGICFVLSGCVSKTNRPTVYVDAEEYAADGIQAYKNAEWHKAQRFFYKALQLYQGIDDQEGALLSYINLAEVSLSLYDDSQTNVYLANAQSIAKHQSLQKYSSRINLLYGLNALQQSQFTEAEQILQALLPAFKGSTLLSTPNSTQLAAISSRTRIAFLSKHDEVLWTKRYANALKKTINKDTDREARLLRFQSDLLLLQGADKEAEFKRLQALSLYKSNQSRKGIAATLLEIAQLYKNKQQWLMARHYFNRSRAVYQFLGENEKLMLIDGYLLKVQSNAH